MVGQLIDSDLDSAKAHAEVAVRRAGRIAAVREARGLVAYREGDWATALSEFRTARRISGSHHLLPMMVDVERALGRPERAIEVAGVPEVRTLGLAEQVELRIVVSGIRRDMGQPDAAVIALQIPQLVPGSREPWAGRLYYAYAEALLASGERAAAREWFAYAVTADTDLATDAAERLDEFDGLVMVDLLDEDEPGIPADDDHDVEPNDEHGDPPQPVSEEPQPLPGPEPAAFELPRDGQFGETPDERTPSPQGPEPRAEPGGQREERPR